MDEVCKTGADRAGKVEVLRKKGKPFSAKDMTFQLASITEQVIDSVISTDLDFKITYVNSAFEKKYGYSRGEVIGLSPGIFNGDADSEEIQNEIYQTVSAGEVWKGDISNRRKDGSTFLCELTIFPLKDENGNTFAYTGIQRDVTARKEAEEALKRHSLRSDVLLKLNKMRDASKEQILDFVREEVIKVTESEFAFLGFLSDDESIMKVESWSSGVMAKCAVADKPMQFPISKAGLWAEAVRQRKAVIINDCSGPQAAKKGFPAGHVSINRYMCIPVFEGDRIVMVAAVANKEGIYDESDIRSLSSMMNDAWGLFRQKEAEDALRFSEDKFSKAFHRSPDSIAVTSIESGRFMEVNKGFEEMSGYSRDEVIGKTTLDINLWQNPDERKAMLKEFSVKGSIRDYEIQGVCKNGDIRELLISCELIEIYSEHCLLSITRDVTEHKRAEERIEGLAKFPSENPNPVLRVDDDSKLLYANDAAKSLLAEWGCKIGERVGSDWQNIIADALQKGTEQITEIEHDGKVFSFAIAPVVNAGYTNLYGRDITERKEAEEQLEVAKERAEAANAAKGDFLANMSHEIRTPMSVIAGFGDILASEELTKQQMAYVELIRNAGKSLLVIINDILDYSKIEAGKLEIYLYEHPLKEIVGDVENMMRRLATDKGLEFEVVWGKGLPEIIETDQVRVNECLVNLVSNAIKFTDDGFVFLKVSMVDRDGEHFIRFDVEDSGIGIPAEDQEHIFDSFSQVEKGSTRNFGGTGLGLAITGQLAGLLGGSVSLASEEGKGSTFTLVIPAGACAGRDKPGEKKKCGRKIIEVKKARPKFSANVLVAEDHEGCRMIVRKMLELYGLKVTTANDGKEAVRKVLKGKFDLVFMDVRMPEYNGFEATGILRQNGVKIPIIALTAHAMEGDRQMCIEAGCNDYLSKPVERDKLLDILGDYVVGKVGKVGKV
ncbi:MAG: PAS domain S-box protein [Planctomycetes bacterium]|nr:PAS domain S-box protein [Planctomycetota bacterium]